MHAATLMTASGQKPTLQTRIEGESRPSEDPLSSSPEVR
jgi:hypothetical protein